MDPHMLEKACSAQRCCYGCKLSRPHFCVAENLVDTIQANIIEMASNQSIVRQIVDVSSSSENGSTASSNGSAATETQPMEGRQLRNR